MEKIEVHGHVSCSILLVTCLTKRRDFILIDKWQNKSWILFILLALAFRFISFFPYVIDHDESTYIIIAQQWLEGKIPYVDNIDVKPIGIYVVFAILLKFVQSVWIIRIGAAIAIGLTAYYLNRASLKFFNQNTDHQVGLLYVFLASLHKWSWSANTEIFFLLFSAIGLYYFTTQKRLRDYLVIGLIFGVGFLFKYHIIFELAAFSIYFILFSKSGVWSKLKRSFLVLLGLLIPISCILTVYAGMGFFQEIWEATYHIPRQYSSSFQLGDTASFIGEFYLSILPFALLFFTGFLLILKNNNKNIFLFSLTWLLLSWVGIMSTGKNYFHYYFQALPCLCFFIPRFSKELVNTPIGSLTQLISKRTTILVILACVITNLNQYLQLSRSHPYLDEVIELIESDLDANEMVYTNHQNILYFLLDSDPPSKYIHTSLLFKADLAHAFGINSEQEIKRIVSKRPKYYLLRGQIPTGFATDIQANCSIVKTFDTNLTLYRRDGS